MRRTEYANSTVALALWLSICFNQMQINLPFHVNIYKFIYFILIFRCFIIKYIKYIYLLFYLLLYHDHFHTWPMKVIEKQ